MGIGMRTRAPEARTPHGGGARKATSGARQDYRWAPMCSNAASALGFGGLLLRGRPVRAARALGLGLGLGVLADRGKAGLERRHQVRRRRGFLGLRLDRDLFAGGLSLDQVEHPLAILVVVL